MTSIEKIRSGKADLADFIEYIGGTDLKVALEATRSKYATPIVLRLAAIHQDRSIRLAAVNNRNITPDLLEMLASDSDGEIAGLAREKLRR